MLYLLSWDILYIMLDAGCPERDMCFYDEYKLCISYRWFSLFFNWNSVEWVEFMFYKILIILWFCILVYMSISILFSNGRWLSVVPCKSLESVTGNWISLKRTQKLSRVWLSSRGLTNLISGAKYPTTNVYFVKVCRIRHVLNEWMKSSKEVIRDMASNMFNKFQKYWKDASDVMTIPIMLDSSYKMKIIEFYFP